MPTQPPATAATTAAVISNGANLRMYVVIICVFTPDRSHLFANTRRVECRYYATVSGRTQMSYNCKG
jgi:hypothetical protein